MLNATHPLSRRDMLRQAGIGFGFTALAGLCAEAALAEQRAASPHAGDGATGPAGYRSPLAAKTPHFAAKAKRVIFLFMQGGPSHLDTFDYKPALAKDAGKTVAAYQGRGGGKLLPSPFKFNPSGKSGLRISEVYPNLAKHADDLCLLNGMHTDNPAHPQATIQMHTGSATFVRPSVGSWVLYGLGTSNQNLPGFITINPPTGLGGAQNYGSAFLPASYQGTRIDGNGIADIRSRLATQGLQRRQLDLVQQMNRDMAAKAGPNPELEGVIESYELGFRMQSAVPEVMDISSEKKETMELYGLSGGDARGSNFGRQCLMARRLVEAGVRYVEVCLPGWDQHGSLTTAIRRNAGATDPGIAGLLEDLKRRDMLKDTLVVWSGEFGRTPAGQGEDGRNHNNRGFTAWMAGGGVKGGMTWGATDEHGGSAVENKTHIHDLHATILHLMGLNHEKLTYRYAGRDFRLTDVYGNVPKEILA